MALAMSRPIKRPGSDSHYLRQRIPADVLSKVGGVRLDVPVGGELVSLVLAPGSQHVRVSLRTADAAEARKRHTVASSYLLAVWQALRLSSPVALSHRQATALSGRLYAAWASEATRGYTTSVLHTPAGWVIEPPSRDDMAAGFEDAASRINAALEDSDPENWQELEPLLGRLVDRLLLAEGIASVQAGSRAILLKAFALALRDAFGQRQREAGGDFMPDPKAERFPAWEPPTPPSPPERIVPARSLSGLVEAWWAEAQAAGRKPSTRQSYANTMANLVAFLKHDVPARVEAADILRFKDARLAAGVSAKTVKDSDLAGLKTVFGWAVANRRMAHNPASGLTIKLGKARKLRSKGFTDAEAAAILSAALTHQPGAERPWTASAKRWVPWLCAYTGARVGELAQLRRQDLRQQGPHWVIRITPEAGTVKTDEAREVVLHPHLVEQGFPAFVAGCPAGHLFLRPGKDGDVLGPLQGLKNRLAEFSRAIVPDPGVAPNHGWRHRFMTVGREAGIEGRVLDAIQGHAARTVGESYGEVSLKAIASAIERLPRY